MITETGRIIAIEAQGVWVETIQRSACDSCRAQKGCGQRALAKMGARASEIWVLLDGRDSAQYHVGDEIRIGIQEDVIAKGALFIYIVPLLLMIGATFIAHKQQMGDGASAIMAFTGLLLGAAIVHWRSYQTRFDNRLQPVVVDDSVVLSANEL
jgi:sigma-E factor negative regulatory protein RseC